MKLQTDVATTCSLHSISWRDFKGAIILDLALGVLLRCAHLRFDGIGRRHSLGEAARPNSFPACPAARVVAEGKAAIGACNSIGVAVNLTGIFRAPNLILMPRWQSRTGSANNSKHVGCNKLHVVMLFVVQSILCFMTSPRPVILFGCLLA